MARPSRDIKILRIPSTDLATYPRLDDLVTLINHAFVTSWRTIPGLVGDDATRYETGAQFAEDMGLCGVTWIAFDAEDKMVATAGYKPWNTVWKVTERIRAQRAEKGEEEGRLDVIRQVEQERREDAGADMEKFEVVAVAVDPSLQKSGLASRLCGEVEKELKERTANAERKRVRLMIRSGRENNEVYWTGKGYRAVGEMKFPIGDLGSRTGFTIVDMERVVDV